MLFRRIRVAAQACREACGICTDCKSFGTKLFDVFARAFKAQPMRLHIADLSRGAGPAGGQGDRLSRDSAARPAARREVSSRNERNSATFLRAAIIKQVMSGQGRRLGWNSAGLNTPRSYPVPVRRLSLKNGTPAARNGLPSLVRAP